MTRTFTWYGQECDSAPLQDGIAAIFNGSTVPVEVNAVHIFPSSGQSASGLTAGTWTLNDISSLTGESDTPIKFDTNSANLPLQVIFTEDPEVTVIGDRIIRRTDSPAMSNTLQNTSMASRLPGALLGTSSGISSDILRYLGNYDSTGLILREGEGIAMFTENFGRGHAMAFAVRVRNVATGACYAYRARDAGTGRIQARPLWGLLNGVGSGVVLEVTNIQMFDDGEATLLNGARLSIIEGWHDRGQAQTFTPAAHDTANPPPAGLVGIQGPFKAVLKGEGGGLTADWAVTHGLQTPVVTQQRMGVVRRLHPAFTGPDVASPLSPFHYGNQLVLSLRGRSQLSLILRPGEGLALLDGLSLGTIISTTYAYYDVSFSVSVLDQSPRAQSTLHS
jgi:hypothetical protein